MWNRFQVDSLHAYGDYDEASMFSYAAGRVVESFYRYNLTETVGATGLREDHTLGNISLLMDYAPLFQRIEMLSDYGIFTPILQTTTLESKPGTQVSLFSLAPSGTISTTGLRWPIRNRRLTAWWQGTLNEATGNNFTVTLSADARIIVYRTLQIM